MGGRRAKYFFVIKTKDTILFTGNVRHDTAWTKFRDLAKEHSFVESKRFSSEKDYKRYLENTDGE